MPVADQTVFGEANAAGSGRHHPGGGIRNACHARTGQASMARKMDQLANWLRRSCSLLYNRTLVPD